MSAIGGVMNHEPDEYPHARSATVGETPIGPFCSVLNADGRYWGINALLDGLESLCFDMSNQEALMFARIVLEANGFELPAGYPNSKDLLVL